MRERRVADSSILSQFIDEIHRFSKSQQRLGAVEKGIVTLIGTAWKIPRRLLPFPLLYVLKPLEKEDQDSAASRHQGCGTQAEERLS